MDKNIKYYKGLADNYFKASLTDSQERELIEFLSSYNGDEESFNEVKALIGYFTVKKEQRSTINKRVIFYKASLSVAALFFIVIILSPLFTKKGGDLCVTYNYGEKITDKEIVMTEVNNTLSSLFSNSINLEEDINNLFK